MASSDWFYLAAFVDELEFFLFLLRQFQLIDFVTIIILKYAATFYTDKG